MKASMKRSIYRCQWDLSQWLWAELMGVQHDN